MSATNVDVRLAALSSTGGFSRTPNRVSDIDTLRELESLSRNAVFEGTGDTGRSGTSSPVSEGRVRELEDKVRRLKIQLAEEQMRNATVIEELQQVRGQLTKSQEVLVSFAQRAREDREEAASTARKRMARSEPSGGHGGGE